MIDSFLFVASTREDHAGNIAKTTARNLKKWRPHLDFNVRANFQTIGPLEYAWCSYRTGNPDRQELITRSIKDEVDALVYGDSLCTGQTRLADTVLQAWRESGPQGVRHLDANFGAVIVDLETSEVLLLNDPLGQRALSFFCSSDTLLASPHDLMIVASGRCPLRADLTSIAAVSDCGWSVGRGSLLQDVERCGPDVFVVWADGSCQTKSDPMVDPENMSQLSDSKLRSTQVDRMIETARTRMRKVISNSDSIRVEMSAGVDSRAVFGLALSAVRDKGQIQAFTIGEKGCIDVKTAREICRRYGVDHSIMEFISAPPNEFLKECDLLSIAVNGDGSSNRLMLLPVGGYTRGKFLQLHGNGGEIYRGLNYPRAKRLGKSRLEVDAARRILIARYMSKDHPSLRTGIRESLRARFGMTLGTYEHYCRDGHDLLDLFHVYEVNAKWGQARSRMTWRLLWSPFQSVDLLRIAFSMPPPIGESCEFHRGIIRRFVRRGYWTRVNDHYLLPLQGTAKSSAVLRVIDRPINRVRRLFGSYGPGHESRSIEQLRSEALNGSLWDLVRDLLASPASISGELFGKTGVLSLLDDHQLRRVNHQSTLASLVTIERWWAQLTELSKVATPGHS